MKWLKGREVVAKVQSAKIDKHSILAKEKLLEKDDASCSFSYQALMIKKEQSNIAMIKDREG